MTDHQMVEALSAVAMVVLAFLALREVICWYWKINAAFKKMAEQTAELKAIRATLDLIGQQGEHKVQLLNQLVQQGRDKTE